MLKGLYLIFYFLPVLICIIYNDLKYILFRIPFFPMVAIFSIVISLFLIWKQDNIKKGKI
jgi:hypothetical protein